MSRKQLLFECFPLAFFVALESLVRNAYRQAHDTCQSLVEKDEVRDLEPYVRRGLIESGLASLAAKYPHDVSADSIKTARHNNHRYLVGRDRVLLTVSYVPVDRKLPKQADFRENLADNQLLLFEPEEFERLTRQKHHRLTYAIVTHSPSTANRSELGTLSVVFVTKACNFLTEINLLELIDNSIKKHAADEQVPDKAAVKLREEYTTKKKTSGQGKNE